MDLRPATSADGPALDALLGRCSVATRYARFHAATVRLPPGATAGDAWVVEDDGLVVAVGNCVDGDLGVLVEDSHQRRGIGTRLVERLVGRAHRGGITVVTARVLAERDRLLAPLRRTVGPGSVVRDGSALVVTIDLHDPAGFVPWQPSSPFLDRAGPVLVAGTGAATRFALAVGPEHTNTRGTAHGGAIAAFADTALGHTAHRWDESRVAVVTASLTVEYRSAVRPGDLLVARVDADDVADVRADLVVGDRVVGAARAVFRQGVAARSSLCDSQADASRSTASSSVSIGSANEARR